METRTNTSCGKVLPQRTVLHLPVKGRLKKKHCQCHLAHLTARLLEGHRAGNWAPKFDMTLQRQLQLAAIRPNKNIPTSRIPSSEGTQQPLMKGTAPCLPKRFCFVLFFSPCMDDPRVLANSLVSYGSHYCILLTVPRPDSHNSGLSAW